MTTWKEAIAEFRKERNLARKYKETRDDLIWNIDSAKTPRAEFTGLTHQLNQEIMKYIFTVRKCKIYRK